MLQNECLLSSFNDWGFLTINRGCNEWNWLVVRNWPIGKPPSWSGYWPIIPEQACCSKLPLTVSILKRCAHTSQMPDILKIYRAGLHFFIFHVSIETTECTFSWIVKSAFKSLHSIADNIPNMSFLVFYAYWSPFLWNVSQWASEQCHTCQTVP